MKKDRTKIKDIPRSPGVYLLYDKEGKIIYIGKAKDLRSRLKNYFIEGSDTYKNKLLKRDLKYYDHILTKTETEALLLENTLIKKHQPRYNILLKDDKSYPYIAYNRNMQFPYFYLTRVKKFSKNTVYFGPYIDGRGIKTFLDYLNMRYDLRLCHGKLPLRPCMYLSMGKCSGVCLKPDAIKYKREFQKALSVFHKSNMELIKEVKEAMSRSAVELKYENAAFYRDVMNFIKKSMKKQLVVNQKGTFDVIAFTNSHNFLIIGIFHYINGDLYGVYTQTYEYYDESSKELIENFLEIYYISNYIPQRIIMTNRIERSTLEYLFNNMLQKNVAIKAPNEKNKDHSYIEFALKNLNSMLDQKKYIDLKSVFLQYPDINIIDAFDISHTSGVYAIGAVVRFKDQKPFKSMYRNYIISNEQAKGDDHFALKQCIVKHFDHLKKHDHIFPDLILIDGGKGQLNTAIGIMNEFHLDIPVISISKDKETDRIHLVDKEPMVLSKTNPVYRFIVSIRDEVHRSGITAHRKKRDGIELSLLTEIPGIGEKRAKKLLQHFGDISHIKKANREELQKFLPDLVIDNLIQFK